ncbi:hypothetical protein F5148DRAFT_1340938 [Russula earlei]|uniref:Uncharacterized protein n=1 Tax=Russula earlei TaxID=71964 RepID=A0ACC0TWI7_9AGAM|nr:hypothetical protein F5148DRAFT_1340938 [Russula earlei]
MIQVCISGCANIIPPGGGPRDSIPPHLLTAVPKDSAINVNSTRITLTFDEFVEVKDAQQNLVISPFPKNTPNVDYKLRTVTIKLRDSLEPNTTYSLNFGNAIRDVNEGNVFKNFTYVFSTGSRVDSNSFSGKVILAETGKIDTTLIVVLHRNLDDSAIVKTRPRYYARLDGKGKFTFNFLPRGEFGIFVVPNDYSKKYDDSTKLFAFLDKPINVSGKDTSSSSLVLYAYEEYKRKEKKPSGSGSNTQPKTGNNNNKPKEDKRLKYSIALDNGQQDLLNDSLRITFTRPLKTLDTSKILLCDTFNRRTPAYHIILDSTATVVTIIHKWKPETPIRLIIGKSAAMDSAGVELPKGDTLQFMSKREEDYGSVKVRFRNLDMSKKPVLEIVANDQIVESVPLTTNSFTRKLFKPGDYELRILYDANGNVAEFSRLPGIGKKTALRLVLHLLKQDVDEVQHFGETIARMRKDIRMRRQNMICVVENIRDVIAIESTQQYNGTYHVLGGIISPLDGVGPGQLTIESLVHRIEKEQTEELLFALNPNIQGDTTIYYIQKKIGHLSCRVTTIARGIAFGGELEYADEMTLARSIANRLPVQQDKATCNGQSTTQDIKDMLEGCRNNQRSSQKLLYEWLKDYGVNICYRYTSNYHEIEELISEGFIKVFKNIQLYDENLYGINEATFKGWFKRILINTCIDAFRKKHSATSMPFVDPETVQHEDKGATALDNLSYKEIIEAIRELSPAPSWEKMEKVLQREMPEEKDKRRRLLLWFFLLAGLAIGGYFLITGTGNDTTTPANRNTAITKTAGQHSASNSAQGVTAVPLNNKKAALQNAGSISDASLATTNKASINATTNQLSTVKQPVAATKLSSNKTAVGNTSSYLDDHSSIVNNKKKIGNRKNGAKNSNDAAALAGTTTSGNDHSDARIATAEDKTSGKSGKEVAKAGDINEIKNNTDAISKTDVAAAATTKPTDTATNKNKTIVPQPPVDSIAKKEDKKKEKVTIPGPLEFTALYGSDVSTVKFTNGDKPGNSFGLLVGYHLSNNWSVRTGAIWTRKIYTVNGSDFKVKSTGGPYPNTLTSVSGFCDMWDIPLDVKYDFHPENKWHFFAEGGLSTYLMSKESYDYDWISSIGTPSYSHSTLNTQRNYLFSVVNLSVGLSTMLSKRVSLQLQPYAKIPLAGVGVGEIHLMSFEITSILAANCYTCHASAVANANGGGNMLEGYNNLKPYADSKEFLYVVQHAPGYDQMPKKRPHAI